jgi:hypothetical protein
VKKPALKPLLTVMVRFDMVWLPPSNVPENVLGVHVLPLASISLVKSKLAVGDIFDTQLVPVGYRALRLRRSERAADFLHRVEVFWLRPSASPEQHVW